MEAGAGGNETGSQDELTRRQMLRRRLVLDLSIGLGKLPPWISHTRNRILELALLRKELQKAQD